MNKYTDAYLIEVLNQFATKHNRLPVCLDMCPPYPSYNTYKRRFKSFTNALILAGLKSEFDHMYWSNLDTYEKWYYLGFIIGDGNIASSYNRFTIKLSKVDTDWINTAYDNFNMDTSLYKTSDSVVMYKNSQQWKSDLSKYGIYPRKSTNATLPMDLITSPEIASAIILGLFDADGCIYVGTDKKGYQTLEFNIVGTKNVCECVQYLLSKYLNITNKSVYLKPGSNVYVVRWGKRSDIELISKFLYQHATLNNICLKRKQNKFKLISR